MTKAIVFLPGIEGSELHLGSVKIWPPGLAGNYAHFDKLKNPAAKPGAVIEAIGFVDVYKFLLDNLRNVAAACSAKFYTFPYDWRKDNVANARKLDKFVTQIRASDGVAEVALVAHSMGGLISRILIEGLGSPENLKAIRGLVAIATPHLGATVALAATLGMHSGGLLPPKKVKILADNPQFPALYQLMPHQGLRKLVDSSGSVQDVFKKATAIKYGLAWPNVQKAKAQNARLDVSRRPGHTHYALVNGTGIPTPDVITFDPGDPASFQITKTDGDDTVPQWSAAGIAPVDEVHSKKVQGNLPWSILGGHSNDIYHAAAQEINIATWNALRC